MGEGPRTLQETGSLLGITRERVRQIQDRAMSKLKAAAGLQKLALRKRKTDEIIKNFQTSGLDITGDASSGILLGFRSAVAQAVETYTVTNDSTDRSYDANATGIDELADVLGTLIADLQGMGLLA